MGSVLGSGLGSNSAQYDNRMRPFVVLLFPDVDPIRAVQEAHCSLEIDHNYWLIGTSWILPSTLSPQFQKLVESPFLESSDERRYLGARRPTNLFAEQSVARHRAPVKYVSLIHIDIVEFSYRFFRNWTHKFRNRDSAPSGRPASHQNANKEPI